MIVTDASVSQPLPLDEATIASINAQVRQHPQVRGSEWLLGAALAPTVMHDCVVAWRVNLLQPSVIAPSIDHLWVGLDWSFPYSQPIVRVPDVKHRPLFPHIESNGDLCLPRSPVRHTGDVRVLQRLGHALWLLSQNRQWCVAEFRREFLSYWTHHLSKRPGELRVVSLLDPTARAGPIVTHQVSTDPLIRVAQDRDTLETWLAHTGTKTMQAEFAEAWFQPLPVPWTPTEFPKTGGDVLDSLSTTGKQFLNRRDTGKQLVVYGADTATGSAMVAVQLNLPLFKPKKIAGRTRPLQVPSLISQLTLRHHEVLRLRCDRADASWVHGRDHDNQLDHLRHRRVAVIGVGALGGYVARLLAQAGVGALVLLDHDLLSAHNTSRHLLGARFVGRYKADAVAQLLREDFPHIKSIVPINSKFELLTTEALSELSSCDVIISAGVSYEADMLLDRWRLTATNVPVHVCTWTEEFALAGHAVALMGAASLSNAFDEEARVKFCLTRWPNTVNTMIQQAGCGDNFQPHGAITLQSTVQLAVSLALDVLIGTVTHSLRRTWCGDRDEVIRRGGMPQEHFTTSNNTVQYDWV